MEEQTRMDRSTTRRSNRKGSVWIVALVVAGLLTGCGTNPTTPAVTTTGATTASTTTLPPEMTSETAATTTPARPAVRPLDGPRAVSDEWILRTGETMRLTESGEDTELLIAWVQIENTGDRSLTVSSLLSIGMTDNVTEEKADVPDLVEALLRISEVDPDGSTLDGEILPGERLSGWIYGEFPSGVSDVTVSVTTEATADASQTETLEVDLIYQQ